MDEIVTGQATIGLTKQLSEFVAWKIKWINSMARESRAKATLANLRRGIGKAPGELPEIWGKFPTSIK